LPIILTDKKEMQKHNGVTVSIAIKTDGEEGPEEVTGQA